MEWLDRLKGKIVGLDTAPLIYFNSPNLEVLILDEIKDKHYP